MWHGDSDFGHRQSGVVKADTEVWCVAPDHKAVGMVATIKVIDPSAEAAG